MDQHNETKAQIDASEEARLKDQEKSRAEKMQNMTREKSPRLPAEQAAVYREALRVLNDSRLPYAVGAAFARYSYTGIWRQTKDLDVFVRPGDLYQVMEALRAAGFETEIRERSWLAKAWKDGQFLDLIFGTGHGQLPVDDSTFAGVRTEKVLGIPAPLMPLEEMIAAAMYIAGRNRFDGPEVAHLIQSAKGKLDWQRILHRLGDNRQLLLWHLILFDYLYPGHSKWLPQDLMAELFQEMQERWKTSRRSSKAFRGTLLDPFSYTVDVEDWGYEDRRRSTPLVDKAGRVISADQAEDGKRLKQKGKSL